MSPVVASFPYAAVANALIWPLAGGIAVVGWVRWRTRARAPRICAVDEALQAAYRTVEASPVPDRLSVVMEALEEGEELAGGRGARGKTPV